VCVMRPDDTLLLKAENEQMNKEWYDAILNSTIPARALRLGRCVKPEEFFEAAYDVTIVETPSVKGKKLNEEALTNANIVDKHPELAGERRLCFYARTIFICRKNIEPAREDQLTTLAIPPFKETDAFELQRNFVNRFAIRSNHFILVMGQGSPMGACDVWAECESEKVATHIHHMLNAIIIREVEKKEKEKSLGYGVKQTEPVLPSVAAFTRGHRVRAHTQPHRPRLISDIMAANKNSPLAHLMRKSSTGTSVCTSGSQRTPPTTLEAPLSSRSVPRSISDASQLVRRSFDSISEDHLIAPSSVFPRRESSDSKEDAGIYQPMNPTDDVKIKEIEQLMRGEMPGHRSVSPSTSGSFAEETEDSGGTIIAFDDLRRNNSIRNLSLMQQSPSVLVPIKCETAHIASSVVDADANVISPGVSTAAGGQTSTMGEQDYEYMDIGAWDREACSSFDLPPYVFTSPRRSNVSSSDSCFSSPSDRHPRPELDFGGEPSPSASSHNGLSSYGSVSLGSVESSSRTSSFGCKSDEKVEKDNIQTPSEMLLQKTKYLSVEECANENDSDYTEMDPGCASTNSVTAAASLCQLTPVDSRENSRDHSVEPVASSTMQYEASSTLQTLFPSLEPVVTATADPQSLPHHPPVLPKRGSVPVLKTMAEGTRNYACLEAENGCDLRSRRRSISSGLMHKAVPDAAYTVVHPIQ
ncbi:hypothetical protein PENTCL1PPCAC_21297, partial [Pristionchus entomophagus]